MRLRLIAAAMLLSACQLALPGQSPAPAAVSPITAGEISVTALDDPGPVAAPAVAEVATATAAEISAAPAAPEAPEVAPELLPEIAPVPPPVASKTASQLLCERRGGNWVQAGTTGTMSCQTPQRDGGKACSRDRDCEGQCLARSRTCAPFAPLFGCNEVLQDNGQRVTLCIQ